MLDLSKSLIDLKKLSIYPVHYPKSPIVEEVVTLTQQLPYDYDAVYSAWVSGCRTLEECERYFGLRF
jgi:hypothetical protein